MTTPLPYPLWNAAASNWTCTAAISPSIPLLFVSMARYYGDLYDHWGGLHDLERGLVRVLHSLSFVDDPTRMLRAVRFEQRFGFQIEPRTLELIDEAREMLANDHRAAS